MVKCEVDVSVRKRLPTHMITSLQVLDYVPTSAPTRLRRAWEMSASSALLKIIALLVTLLVTRTLVLKEIEEMLAKNQNPDMRRWSDVWMKIFCLVSSVRCCLSFVSCFLQTRLRIGVRSTPYGPIGFRQTRKGCVLSQPSSPYPSLHTVKDPNHCPAACCVSRPSKGYMQLIHVSYSLRTICAVHCFP
ncbi:hypothetical protein Y032_0089g2302 [Ancylostoma ceylanicum]|uniref:Uncharacterized protein n=1 Tax=Ancylostoma ceylanicum TaxID=53326 RepID=A0A016TNI8_9BILA|nr:hypothetical protein Y032_0089g2302 [Ancylostoma ceylanicum]